MGTDLIFIKRRDDRVVIIAQTQKGMDWCARNLVIDQYDSGHEVISIIADNNDINDYVTRIREEDLTVEVE